MGYSRELYEKAAAVLERRRLTAEKEAELRRTKFGEEYPEFLSLDAELSRAGLDVIKALGMGKDAEEYINRLSLTNLEIQKKKAALLAKTGKSPEYLNPDYTCKKCNDTGFIDGKICACHLNLLKQLSFDELCGQSQLKLSSFDTFSLKYYDGEDKKRMEKVLSSCKSYAAAFDLNSPNLFFYGSTGLGKTHLSLAIANEVLKNGFTVLYGSAQNLISKLEREKFGRCDTPDGTTENMLLSCDLLILDDLGAEFSTAFTVSAVYNIINSRICSGKPVIINSNFGFDELEKRYSDRVTSRIIGNYTCIEFCGNDIRQKKRE